MHTYPTRSSVNSSASWLVPDKDFARVVLRAYSRADKRVLAMGEDSSIGIQLDGTLNVFIRG